MPCPSSAGSEFKSLCSHLRPGGTLGWSAGLFKIIRAYLRARTGRRAFQSLPPDLLEDVLGQDAARHYLQQRKNTQAHWTSIHGR